MSNKRVEQPLHHPEDVTYTYDVRYGLPRNVSDCTNPKNLANKDCGYEVLKINASRSETSWYLNEEKKISGKGTVGKFFSEDSLKELMQNCGADVGDSIFLACGKEKEMEQILLEEC